MLCCSANKSFFFNHTSVASLYTVALFFFYYDIWFCASLAVILCINVFFLVCQTLTDYPSCYWFCSWFSSSFYGSLSLHTTSYFLKSISWQLHDKYMYWRMQMKPYLLSYGICFFIDGSLPCPSSHLIPSSMVVPVHNPTFVSWKQQDHLIMSALWLWVLSCPLYLLNSYTWLLIDIPRPLYGRILSKLSPHHQILVLYNSMGLSRTYDKGDDTTNTYLQKTKSLFDELATAGQPIALADSISMFLGVCVENSKTWLLASPPKLRHLLILSYIAIYSPMNIFIKLLLIMTNVLASLLPTLSSGSSTILPYSYSLAATELEI